MTRVLVSVSMTGSMTRVLVLLGPSWGRRYLFVPGCTWLLGRYQDNLTASSPSSGLSTLHVRLRVDPSVSFKIPLSSPFPSAFVTCSLRFLVLTPPSLPWTERSRRTKAGKERLREGSMAPI